MKTLYFVLVILLVLTSLFQEAGALQTNQFAIWGIADSEIVIPAGGVITEAVLTVIAVWPQNALFKVQLMDNANAGYETGTDATGGVFFASHGIPLSGTYVNGDYVCRFSQNNIRTPMRSIFPEPTSITLADSTTALLSSTLLELMDYAGNSKGFGIGIDPGNTANLTITGLKLVMTIESYLFAGSSELILS
jgi:hypothetical protein